MSTLSETDEVTEDDPCTAHALSRPPIFGADLWTAVMRAAQCRCQCTGQCGKVFHSGQSKGAKRNERCPTESTGRKPLHVVPDDPSMGLMRASCSSAYLRAYCEDCRRGRDRLYAKAMRDACGMGDPEQSILPGFDLENDQ